MIALTKSLALCTIFIFLSISILLFISVFYICKYHYERIQLAQCAILMKPEEVNKRRTAGECEKGDIETDIDIELPYYTNVNVPRILLTSEELPPDYHELESARASPLPSYDDVMYCDQLNRSFQNLLSAR
ncbi:Protein CBG09556 [Caenorhabditis briggsae]|uniref:Uncharacterized protein n=2 Tax=Caenorhabditis briggsae TaxID=6238 RepID=A0AAE9D1B2_CAEBR|nr:Protein CBG09556 [Caenorhabditis briggsae]ULT89719.1 hypothetical protein L3Y34_008252 [Caenorhabditis briggsae]UMM35525.1 hypothetical protein L5515_008103 [Caenorhabditis briggsae]CAP29049.2 Protein CBG09556 [Caenorhabditis briggsae]